MHTFTTIVDVVYARIMQITEMCVDFWIRNSTETQSETHTSITEVNEPVHVDVSEEVAPTFKSVDTILHSVHAHEAKIVMYAGLHEVPVYTNPTIEFDSCIARIPFGETVMVREPKGRFYSVSWNGRDGWVLKDDLVDRAVRIYPDFIRGAENDVDSENTIRIRSILGDVFGLKYSEFPLQSGEYVLYKLWRRGIKVEWPEVRPRVPGSWHTILKGAPGVHIAVTPKVGSIMECSLDNEMGHLAYVEAVFPDATIAISEAHYPDSGIYNERELTKTEWLELKPIFIHIT